MFWGYSSMRTFHSVVPSSIMKFYKGLGITRDVASRAEPSRYPLRALFSVRYYFQHNSDKKVEMVGFEKIATENGFDVYENKNELPMGLTFDYYVTEEQFNSKVDAARDMLLLKGLYLNRNQIVKYANILNAFPDEDMENLYDENEYFETCQERLLSSAYYFKPDGKGFTSKINLEKENLVFFSVPFDKGFSATVNGKKAEIA